MKETGRLKKALQANVSNKIFIPVRFVPYADPEMECSESFRNAFYNAIMHISKVLR